MKTLKKMISIIISLLIIIGSLGSLNIKIRNIVSTSTENRSVIRIGVLLNNFYNPYNLLIKKSLEDIEKENLNKVHFTFFDGSGNFAVENSIINEMIEDDYDLIVAAIVDKKSIQSMDEFVYKASQKNVPIIFVNTTPTNLNPIKGYSKSIIINTDSVQAAILQGKMIAGAWNADKQSIDKNGDNILQYIMIEGEPESFAAKSRTEYSILTLNNAGIQTQELATTTANWNPDIAESAISQLFLKYNGKVEAIISNNDAMALGAIKALQNYGYNKGDKSKTIPVYGIGGIPEAQDLIKKGFMAGTVLQNPRLLADAIYTIGMNLVSGKAPIEGTNYKVDKTGVIVLIPFEEYKG